MNWQYVIIGACLKIIGWSTAIDTYAELPWKPDGMPWWDCSQGGCTTSILGEAEEVPGSDGELCWLPAPKNDTWFDPYWCQPVIVYGVEVTTPCVSDMIAKEDAPYPYKVYWAELNCPEWMQTYEWCTPEIVVCSTQDEIDGYCVITP